MIFPDFCRILNLSFWFLRIFGFADYKTDYSIDEVGGFTNIYDSASAFGDNALKRFDFGLGLKAGIEFCQKYQLSIGYDWGLTDNIENGSNKNRNLMLSLGYCF